MTAKQMTDIAESLEKLGYEIIKIKEKKKAPDFPRSPAITQILITPIKSNADKPSIKNKKLKTSLQTFKDEIKK